MGEIKYKRRLAVVGGCAPTHYSWFGPMNLPNALTILRIFFVPLLVAALVQDNVGFASVA